MSQFMALVYIYIKDIMGSSTLFIRTCSTKLFITVVFPQTTISLKVVIMSITSSRTICTLPFTGCANTITLVGNSVAHFLINFHLSKYSRRDENFNPHCKIIRVMSWLKLGHSNNNPRVIKYLISFLFFLLLFLYSLLI